MLRTILLTLLLIPATASAQERLLKGLTTDGMPTVFVTDDRGVETRGNLVKLGEEAVTLLVDGQPRRLEMAHVTRIQRRGDSLKNGSIAGAIVGLCLGILSAGAADCSDHCGVLRSVAVAASMGIYAAAGAGIDAAVKGRTDVYRAPSAQTPGGGKRAAVGFSVRW